MKKSPQPRPRTKPAEVRREELLDAAERILLSKGVAATSVDEIVLGADVAKGTFYLHFDSKEKLLLALQARFVGSFARELATALSARRPDDWHGRLRAWIGTAVAIYLERTAQHDLVFHQFRAPERHAEHEEDPVVDQLAALLEQGDKAGAWSVATPRVTAIMLFASLHAALDDALHGKHEREPPQRKRLTRALETFFERVVQLEAEGTTPTRKGPPVRSGSRKR